MKRIVVLGLVFCMTIVSVVTPARAESSNTMNFRFNPLGLLIGALDINLDFQVNEEWTIGPELALINFEHDREGVLTEDIEIKGYGIGVRGNWFSNGVFNDGLYLSPSLIYGQVKATTRDAVSERTAEGGGASLGFLAGYGWFWESFNIMLGAGLAIPVGDSEVTVTDSAGNKVEVVPREARLAGEFSLGWTF